MKLSILTSVSALALIAAAPAFAQAQHVKVNQTGTNATATVSQSGANSESDVTQGGNLNTATVNQNGAIDGGKSTITQTGSSNSATVDAGRRRRQRRRPPINVSTILSGRQRQHANVDAGHAHRATLRHELDRQPGGQSQHRQGHPARRQPDLVRSSRTATATSPTLPRATRHGSLDRRQLTATCRRSTDRLGRKQGRVGQRGGLQPVQTGGRTL